LKDSTEEITDIGLDESDAFITLDDFDEATLTVEDTSSDGLSGLDNFDGLDSFTPSEELSEAALMALDATDLSLAGLDGFDSFVDVGVFDGLDALEGLTPSEEL
jgi:hypothetical protein